MERSAQKHGETEISTVSLAARPNPDTNHFGDSVTLESLFEPRKLLSGTILPRRIFIQGRAGVGKTSLCKKLVYEYLQGRLAKNLFDRLLWIPLCRLKGKKEHGWQDLIQNTHILKTPKWEQAKEVYSNQFYDSAFLSRTLLLFDGLDEISYDRKHEMYEFLEDIIYNSPNVIITSRPQSKSFNIGRFDLELETIGFSLSQINTYLETCIPQSNEIARMKSFMAKRPLIQGLLRIPIQLDAFCCTWPSKDDMEDHNELYGSKRDSISTMTNLYQSISLELCRKDIARFEGTDLAKAYQSRHLKNFEVSKILENELKFLSEFAFQGMVNNIVEFNPKHQDRIGSYASQTGLQLTTPYSSVLERMSFLRTSDIEQDQSKQNCHFIHLTFQEFFAAKHFAEH